MSITPAGPTSKFTINYDDGTGNLPTSFIIVTVQFTYQGKTVKFSTDPIPPDAGKNTYTVDAKSLK